ncbi:IS2 transposase TnpB [Aminobacter sp. MSH1]|nr:IS2 transposase TnpB [Aminobacter sp. MSH1]
MVDHARTVLAVLTDQIYVENGNSASETPDRQEHLAVLSAATVPLQRHTAQRPAETHDGVVVALRLNVRWCSDHLELRARDSQVVRVLFVIDACDREIIGWLAVAKAGISAEMVCDLMVTSVELRSAYIARQTAHTVAALGLTLLFTPVRSTQSHGCPSPSSIPS